MKEQDCQPNQWSLVRIIGVDGERNGDVRSVTLRIEDSNNGNQALGQVDSTEFAESAESAENHNFLSSLIKQPKSYP